MPNCHIASSASFSIDFFSFNNSSLGLNYLTSNFCDYSGVAICTILILILVPSTYLLVEGSRKSSRNPAPLWSTDSVVSSLFCYLFDISCFFILPSACVCFSVLYFSLVFYSYIVFCLLLLVFYLFLSI